tara:strand:- start:2666 stop:2977 length:312 start_codon:yes stop_codon:yes gene_type:complete
MHRRGIRKKSSKSERARWDLLMTIVIEEIPMDTSDGMTERELNTLYHTCERNGDYEEAIRLRILMAQRFYGGQIDHWHQRAIGFLSQKIADRDCGPRTMELDT